MMKAQTYLKELRERPVAVGSKDNKLQTMGVSEIRGAFLGSLLLEGILLCGGGGGGGRVILGIPYYFGKPPKNELCKPCGDLRNTQDTYTLSPELAALMHGTL